jgi:hypothetical protein
MSIWNKSLKKSLLLFMGLFFFAANTQASHIVGGEVWYQWISGNTYQVGLNLYRDCGGLTPPATVNVSYDGCGVSGSILLTQTGTPVTVTALCQSSIANSSCNGGSLYSIQRITYSGTVTLPFACSFWVFSYDECCRTNLSNISSPSSTDMYYKAILNNVAAPQNNSARFNTVATTIIPVNATSDMDWSAYDADGDSLVYISSFLFGITALFGCPSNGHRLHKRNHHGYTKHHSKSNCQHQGERISEWHAHRNRLPGFDGFSLSKQQ